MRMLVGCTDLEHLPGHIMHHQKPRNLQMAVSSGIVSGVVRPAQQRCKAETGAKSQSCCNLVFVGVGEQQGPTSLGRVHRQRVHVFLLR